MRNSAQIRTLILMGPGPAPLNAQSYGKRRGTKCSLPGNVRRVAHQIGIAVVQYPGEHAGGRRWRCPVLKVDRVADLGRRAACGPRDRGGGGTPAAEAIDQVGAIAIPADIEACSIGTGIDEMDGVWGI